MDWIEIAASGPVERKDEAAYRLMEAGSPGVEEVGQTSEAGRLVLYSLWEDETREEAPSGASATLRAYLPADEGKLLAALATDLKKIGWAMRSAPFKDQDWTVKWKAGIKPIRVSYRGSSIVVRPTWEKKPKMPGEVVIEIDPGMAFGTGGHATTKMCLKAIMELIKGKKVPLKASSILDVGTGTGVLAIAAVKLGIKKAVGIDIDRVALKVARKNARHNGARLTISSNTVEALKGAYSIVAANILAGELIRLAPLIRARVAPGGFLILSGILREESDSVLAAYSALGVKPVKAYSGKEWSALLFFKPVVQARAFKPK